MPDVQHAQIDRRVVVPWRRAIVSRDGTHHEFDGASMYAARFGAVQKFHEPGLAPALDVSGAFHIGPEGTPAYARRFRQTWGFYDGLAAVSDESGWFHVRADGAAAYEARFAWAGNFQEQRCAVRTDAQRYYHIEIGGSPAYEARHLYAGDYRDGVAVVRFTEDGLCGHVDPSGKPIHNERFLDLDSFHKGLARARDRRGWLHVDRSGRPAYSERFAAVEAFYNGQALVETLAGARAVIGVDGLVRVEIGSADR